MAADPDAQPDNARIGGVDQLQSSSGQRLGHLGDHAKHPVGFTRT
jgi:hypothetical protein